MKKEVDSSKGTNNEIEEYLKGILLNRIKEVRKIILLACLIRLFSYPSLQTLQKILDVVGMEMVLTDFTHHHNEGMGAKNLTPFYI